MITYSQWDSNPHSSVFETVASAVGLWEIAPMLATRVYGSGLSPLATYFQRDSNPQRIGSKPIASASWAMEVLWRFHLCHFRFPIYVAREGIEPPSAACRTAALPLDEQAVENNGFEPMLSVCNADVLPLTLIPQWRRGSGITRTLVWVRHQRR